MPIDNSTLSIAGHSRREAGQGFVEKASKVRNRPDSTGEGAVPVRTARGSEAVLGGGDLREAFRKVKQSVLKQSNEFISLTNEKSALIESASSVTQKQLESAGKIKLLMQRGASPPELEAEQQRFEKMHEVSQEVEEEIAAHNIESGGDPEPVNPLNARTFETPPLKPIEYRSVQGDVSSPDAVEQTLYDLKNNHQQLNRQKTELQDLREQIRTVTKQSLEEVKDFSSISIKSVAEAAYAAQGIADLVAGGGGVDLLVAHGDLLSSDSVSALLEEEQ